MSQQLKQWDELIRAGNVEAVQKELQSLTLAHVERADYAALCALARRAGLPEISIRLLHVLVRDPEQPQAPATIDERVEYAMALIKIGAIEEGRTLLKEIPRLSHAQGHLFLALSYFNDWKYADSISLLREYSREFAVDEYQELVANINLCSALLWLDRLEEAEEILAKSLMQAAGDRFKLARGNLLELSAQILLKQMRLSEAEDTLNEAAKLIGQGRFASALFVQKWMSLLQLCRQPNSPASLNAFMLAKNRAIELRHWETVRDLDFYCAVFRRDADLYHHLFHGTPHAAYRNKLRERFPFAVEPANEYLWALGAERAGYSRSVINLASPNFKGGLIHLLLLTLAADFYRPVQLASLATQLFPGEYYNPHSTDNRIHQLVTRFRTWASEQKLPLAIEVDDRAYRLVAERPVYIRTSMNLREVSRAGGDKSRLVLESFRMQAGATEFTAKQMCAAMNCSLSTATRVLRAAIAEGHVSSAGIGKSIKYKFRAA